MIERLKGRVWFKFDAHAPGNYKLAQLPNDAVRWTWVLMLCEAKLQRLPGCWHNWRHLQACLRGRRPSHARMIQEAGLLIEDPRTGVVRVPAWEEWQANPTEVSVSSNGTPVAWIRLDALCPRHRKLASLKSDSVRWTWIMALCEAKLQSPQGEWTSYQHFRACLCGKPSRQLLDLFEVSLIDYQNDARVAVHNWERWQSEPPRSGAERQRRYRERKLLAGQAIQLRLEGCSAWPDVTNRDAGEASS